MVSGIIWKDLLICPSLALHSPKSCRIYNGSFANAAVAIIASLQSTSNTGIHYSSNLGISPGKKAKLWKEYIDQLKDIQKLRDDATLTQEEFEQEKQLTLKSMK